MRNYYINLLYIYNFTFIITIFVYYLLFIKNRDIFKIARVNNC